MLKNIKKVTDLGPVEGWKWEHFTPKEGEVGVGYHETDHMTVAGESEDQLRREWELVTYRFYHFKVGAGIDRSLLSWSGELPLTRENLIAESERALQRKEREAELSAQFESRRRLSQQFRNLPEIREASKVLERLSLRPPEAKELFEMETILAKKGVHASDEERNLESRMGELRRRFVDPRCSELCSVIDSYETEWIRAKTAGEEPPPFSYELGDPPSFTKEREEFKALKEEFEALFAEAEELRRALMSRYGVSLPPNIDLSKLQELEKVYKGEEPLVASFERCYYFSEVKRGVGRIRCDNGGAGWIIGKKGARIKSLAEKFGLKYIKVE